MNWYICIYAVVLTECGGDDGQLDTAIHHQPHAQAQQQHGKYHNNTRCLVCTCLKIIPALIIAT